MYLMQQNHLRFVSNQNIKKNQNPDCVLRKPVIPVVDKCKYLGIVVSEANCDGLTSLHFQMTISLHEGLV